MRILPAHPNPRKDDRFSFWVFETACQNGLSVEEFCERIGVAGTDRLDLRSPDDPLVLRLVEATGKPLESITDTLAWSLQGIFPKSSNRLWPYESMRPWWLQTSPGRSAREQYCPECLSDFKRLRLSWLFALRVSCPAHNRLLCETCPHCGAPIAGIARLYRKVIPDSLVAICTCQFCGGDLRACEAPVPPDPCVSAFEQLYDDALRNPNAIGFFAVLHKLSRVLGRNSHSSDRLRRLVFGTSNIPWGFVQTGASFEAQDAAGRMVWLAAVVTLFEEWPARFVDSIRVLSTDRHVLKSARPLPNWYRTAVDLGTALTRGSDQIARDQLLEASTREGWYALAEGLASGRLRRPYPGSCLPAAS